MSRLSGHEIKKMRVEELREHSLGAQTLTRLFPEVRWVQDQAEDIGIVVTADDIRNAQPGNPARCAVVLAAKRLPEVGGSLISKTVSYLIKGDLACRYITPANTWVRLVVFDITGKAEPGIYVLKAPTESSRLLGMQRRQAASDAARRSTKRYPPSTETSSASPNPSKKRPLRAMGPADFVFHSSLERNLMKASVTADDFRR